jgi:hypothetical protein
LEWDQEDLDPGHMNILDTSGEVFLWTGQRANIEEEKKQTMETVLEYTKLHPIRKENDSCTDDVLSVYALRCLHPSFYVPLSFVLFISISCCI